MAASDLVLNQGDSHCVKDLSGNLKGYHHVRIGSQPIIQFREAGCEVGGFDIHRLEYLILILLRSFHNIR